MGIQKRRISHWFQIRCKSFEKMHTKKVNSKNMMEICPFSLFFVYNFLLVHFLQLFQRIQNQPEILNFLISSLIKKKKSI